MPNCKRCNSKIPDHFFNKYSKYCILCNMLNYKYPDNLPNFTVCYSSMDQDLIIKNTIEYFQKKNKYPEFNLIDKRVELIKISPLEYVAILQEYEDNDKEIPSFLIENYKFFVNTDINIATTPSFSFEIDNDLDDDVVIVDDEDTIDPDDNEYKELTKKEKEYNIKIHKFSVYEKKILNQDNNNSNKIKEFIETAKEEHEYIKQKLEKEKKLIY